MLFLIIMPFSTKVSLLPVKNTILKINNKRVHEHGEKFYLLKLRGKYAHTLMEQFNQDNERFTRNEFQLEMNICISVSKLLRAFLGRYWLSLVNVGSIYIVIRSISFPFSLAESSQRDQQKVAYQEIAHKLQ